MVAWAEAYGVQKVDGLVLTTSSPSDDDVHIGTHHYSDVFMTTLEDLPGNNPVMFIPNEMILSSYKAIQEFGRLENAEKILEERGSQNEIRQYYLMLKILYEWERGEESPWFPYLNALPRYFSNGASMTHFCYKCLPPLAGKLAMSERAMLNRLMIKKVPFLSLKTRSDDKLWKWAFQIVHTRSFEANNGSGDLCIAPMADMFNHGSEATEVALGYDKEGNCYAQTTRDIPSGSHLRMSYGDSTNPSFFLARYGFLEENTPATNCKLIPKHINNEMRDLGYTPERMLFYNNGEVSQEVWDILLYQILTEIDGDKNMERRNEFYRAHMNGDYGTKQEFHPQYYPQTSAKLLDHIDTFLQQLDALSGKMTGRNIKDYPRVPLILKHNDFVKNIFLTVRAQYFP